MLKIWELSIKRIQWKTQVDKSITATDNSWRRYAAAAFAAVAVHFFA